MINFEFDEKMTRKLFWETPYEREFSAKVISITDEGIILDQTLFYPFGGNQLSDQGVIKIKDFKIPIKNVTKEDEKIIHHISTEFHKKIKVGDEVIGKIDWKRRYGLMKSHSSQHIFSAVIKNKYNIDTVRANIEFEDISLSISQELSHEQLKSALQEINEICISRNLKFEGKIISPKDLGRYENNIRGNIPSEDQIRIVEINDLDLVCCGGTHVQNSTEIGPLYLYNFKKGKEIKYYIGDKALNLITHLNVDLLELSNSLNAPIEKVKEKSEKNMELISAYKEKNEILLNKTLEIAAQSPISKINDILVFFLDFKIDHKTIAKNLHLFPLESFLIIKMSAKRFRFISKTQYIDANSILQVFIKKYGGKGGGNPNSAQGTFEIEPKSIISELKQIIIS